MFNEVFANFAKMSFIFAGKGLIAAFLLMLLLHVIASKDQSPIIRLVWSVLILVGMGAFLFLIPISDFSYALETFITLTIAFAISGMIYRPVRYIETEDEEHEFFEEE